MRARWLTKPSTGFLVLGGLAVVLGLIVYAAYHGSDATSSSECGSAHNLLRRVLADATTARTQLATTGSTSSSAITRDDNDVNNFINGQQHQDAGFDGVVLPLADALGRAATDLGASVASATDVNRLVTAATDAAGYCRISA